VNTTKEFYIDSPEQDLNPIVLKPDDKILIGTPQPAANPNRIEDAAIASGGQKERACRDGQAANRFPAESNAHQFAMARE